MLCAQGRVPQGRVHESSTNADGSWRSHMAAVKGQQAASTALYWVSMVYIESDR